MIELNSSDLPETPRTESAAPLAKLTWGGSAPAINVNPYARYQDVPFDPISLPMPRPDSSGRLIEVVFPGPVADVNSISWADISFPMWLPGDPLPGYGWYDAERAFIYVPGLIPATAPSLLLTANFTTPEPDQDQYRFDLGAWENFAIAQVTIEGLTFRPAHGDFPMGGEFIVTGNTLILTGSASFKPAPLSVALVIGVWSASAWRVVGAIATFSLQGTNLDYPDQVDYLGVTYQEVPNIMAPQPPCFYWSGRRLSLVADIKLLPALAPAVPAEISAGSALGESTYRGLA